MNNRIKHTYREGIRKVFSVIQTHPGVQRVMMLPFTIRLLLSSLLFVIGIIALLTPIPAGWAMLLTAAVLIFGFHMVRRQSVKLFFMFRLHKFWEWIMRWRRK